MVKVMSVFGTVTLPEPEAESRLGIGGVNFGGQRVLVEFLLLRVRHLTEDGSAVRQLVGGHRGVVHLAAQLLPLLEFDELLVLLLLHVDVQLAEVLDEVHIQVGLRGKSSSQGELLLWQVRGTPGRVQAAPPSPGGSYWDSGSVVADSRSPDMRFDPATVLCALLVFGRCCSFLLERSAFWGPKVSGQSRVGLPEEHSLDLRRANCTPAIAGPG